MIPVHYTKVSADTFAQDCFAALAAAQSDPE